MTKPYARFMAEISAEELYAGLVEHGLFADRVPPIFDCGAFLKYCQETRKFKFANKPYRYVKFKATRNIGIPRALGIPVPMAHERLCACLSDCWPELQSYFKKTTKGCGYKKSGMHLKKRKHTTCLFQMRYGHPECDCEKLDLMIGKRYLVKTDVAQCFPSTYSYTVPWALVGREEARKHWSNQEWYNRIDSCTRNSMGGEMRGILIGPHTSNLLSEIVLCAVDSELKEWNYVRMIDDYECFVESEEEANRFLLCLSDKLAKYGLTINQRKTSVGKLPTARASQWIYPVRELAMVLKGTCEEPLSWTNVEIFLHKCIRLTEEYGGNTSILYYALKVLAQKRVTKQAKRYITKTATSLALLHPYLVPMLDEWVYSIYKPSISLLANYLNRILGRCIRDDHLDGAAHALQMAVKYHAILKDFDVEALIEKEDCILLLSGLLYCRRHQLGRSLTALRKHANWLNLSDGKMEEFWPFVYECLSASALRGDWKDLKKAGVSFLREEYW